MAIVEVTVTTARSQPRCPRWWSWPPPQMPTGLRWVAWGHQHGPHIQLDICTGSAPHETILCPTCPVPAPSYAAMSPCHCSTYSAGCAWRLGKGDPCAVCRLQLRANQPHRQMRKENERTHTGIKYVPRCHGWVWQHRRVDTHRDGARAH